MKEKKFKLQHLFFGTAGLLIVEALLLRFFPMPGIGETFILLSAVIGAVMTVYVSIEAIEEVKSRLPLLCFLSLILLEFVVFFTFQYGFLLSVQPASFPTLGTDAISLLLNSMMIFIFNPLYLPATAIGRVILLLNTFSALVLVLFILQNIWQLRQKAEAHASKK